MPTPLVVPRPVVEKKPTRLRRSLQVLAVLAALGLVGTLLVFAFLATSAGRAAVASVAGPLLSSRIRGTANIGSVTRLDFDGIEMRDVTITSPGGTRVIDARRWEADFAYGESFRRGALVMQPSTLDGGSMRITQGPEDRIDLVYAMEVPSDRWMPNVEVGDIRLRNLSIVFSLPGIPGEVEMADVSGLIDMRLGHQFHCRMDGLRGFVNIPIVHIGFSRLEGRMQSDVAIPLVVRMVLDLEVAEPSMEMRYVAPATVGGDAGGHMDITLGVDVPDENHVGTRRTPE